MFVFSFYIAIYVLSRKRERNFSFINKRLAFFRSYGNIDMNERSYERNKNTMDIKTTSPIDKGSILSISKLFKVISDPTRLSVLFLLQKKECSVGNIAISLDMEQSAISHQLKTLKDARLVKSRREGKSMLYSLDDLHVFSILEQVLTHVNELEK